MASRILRLPEVTALTSLGRTSIYARMEAGTFPQAFTFGPKSVGWDSKEIEEWIEQAKLNRHAARTSPNPKAKARQVAEVQS
jgi:prophage regulatory protein